ncbi:hexameric tyrosine-coordinated heme protein [Halomonas pelophila]
MSPPRGAKGAAPPNAEDADGLIAASHVITTHYQTVAAANKDWRE